MERVIQKKKTTRFYFLIDFFGISIQFSSNKFGTNEVVIYNFYTSLTIDTNISQFIKAYHNFYKLQNYNEISYEFCINLFFLVKNGII